MTDSFLTEAQVVELTGAAQAKKQKEVLSRNGIFFVTKMNGGITLTWGMVNNPGRANKHSAFDAEPDFKAMG
jgi:hypothetical protein